MIRRWKIALACVVAAVACQTQNKSKSTSRGMNEATTETSSGKEPLYVPAEVENDSFKKVTDDIKAAAQDFLGEKSGDNSQEQQVFSKIAEDLVNTADLEEYVADPGIMDLNSEVSEALEAEAASNPQTKTAMTDVGKAVLAGGVITLAASVAGGAVAAYRWRKLWKAPGVELDKIVVGLETKLKSRSAQIIAKRQALATARRTAQSAVALEIIRLNTDGRPLPMGAFGPEPTDELKQTRAWKNHQAAIDQENRFLVESSNDLSRIKEDIARVRKSKVAFNVAIFDAEFDETKAGEMKRAGTIGIDDGDMFVSRRTEFEFYTSSGKPDEFYGNKPIEQKSRFVSQAEAEAQAKAIKRKLQSQIDALRKNTSADPRAISELELRIHNVNADLAAYKQILADVGYTKGGTLAQIDAKLKAKANADIKTNLFKGKNAVPELKNMDLKYKLGMGASVAGIVLAAVAITASQQMVEETKEDAPEGEQDAALQLANTQNRSLEQFKENLANAWLRTAILHGT